MMEFTGERFVPGRGGQLRVEHLQRYALVRHIVRGKRVLDLATGEGYGAAMLAATASGVIGVDRSVDAIAHASATYRAPNLHFAVGACEAVPLARDSVDVIVSFETIEHLWDHDAMMRECRRVLVTDGILIISSPEKQVYGAKAPNPYHRRELTLQEFELLLNKHFGTVRVWGQRVAVGCFTYALDATAAPRRTFAAMQVSDDLRDAVSVLPAPEYSLAVCGEANLDALTLDSVALDPDDDIYATLVAAIQAYDAAVRAAGDELAAVHETYAARLSESQAETASVRSVLEAQCAEKSSAVDGLRQELAVVYGSRSWRLTRPLRELRRAGGRLKYKTATRIEPVFRSLYRRLPVASHHRWRLKTAVFRSTGWLMRGTASYQHWAGTERRTRGAGANGRRPLTSADVPERIALPSVDSPTVSVIIPMYGHVDRTRRCLASIARHAPAAAIEVIVIDDASPEPAAQGLSGVEGAFIVRNEQNEGFIRSSNRGAREARGRFLLFLNNDTEVLPGWCDELLGTFDAVPAAGVVGAKLLFPDGTLQEAGGIMWRDGSAWNYGKFDDPAKPEYSYRREVDYVSGAALMLPVDLFWEVGGFDEHFRPAYYEDCDLAFKVRDAGRVVLFQPMSRIVHDEGATSGTDLATGVKRYQVDNRKKFHARWHERLAGQFEPGRSVFLARERSVSRRVLVLDHCTPEPDKDAGSIVVFATMRVLQTLGYKVTFVPEDNYLFVERYTEDLERLGIECLSAPFVTSVEQYLAAHGDQFDLVLIFRFTAALRNLDAVRRHAPQARVILDTVDLHFLRESREGDLRADARISERAERTKQDELAIIGRVDCTIVHNPIEQALLAHERPEARVVVFGWTIDVPGTTAPFGPRRDLAFVGGYQHPPNVDAARYFTSEVFPLVQRQLPDVRLHLVGSNPTASLRSLASDRVYVRGFVPDLGAFLDGVRLTVAPLRYGAGIKGKIATSLSHGVPCVTTPLGAEGMGLEHERHVLVADSSEALAAEVVRVYQDQELWESLSSNGLAFVRDQYSFERARRLFADVLHELGVEPEDPRGGSVHI